MVVNFLKRVETAVVKMYFKKTEEHRMRYEVEKSPRTGLMHKVQFESNTRQGSLKGELVGC